MRLARFAALCAALALDAATVSAQSRLASADSAFRTASNPLLRHLRWRNVGPFRGGRAVAVAGDPNRRELFYFGSVNGGVWKTTNGGQSWQNISDGKSNISSVGAIAVAPSDPNVIYVGTGEAQLREDLTYGDGVYRSTDGGESWQHVGLEDSRQIATVRVDPKNPDLVYVAAMGHAFGPNSMRGVYRSKDGGQSWKRLLFLDDSTGAIDLALDPGNPRILYAAMWKFQRFPWGMSAGGGRSGLWKSTDGGDSWTELSANPGLPHTLLGKIGIAVSPAQPSRLWASVEAPDSAGGIFRSDDAGKTWERVNGDQKFMVRPWYYSAVTADPTDPNTVYVMNLGTWRSVDGGKTFTNIRVPHGDCHILWIDPRDSQRMIHGNDGGATVSFDAGATWSSIYNQPTAQFYHVTTDNQFPYRIYGAQQDNSTVSIASRSDQGAITRQDWYPVGGGESGYIAPHPDDPNIVYAGTYMGTLTRYDHRTKQAKDVSVWLNNYDGIPASEAPYRFQWTFPILFSPHDSKTLYVTANRVFKSINGGDSWQAISPDLTVADPATLGPSGGPITRDMTGTEWYATIFAFAESPVTKGVLWAGSDDGLIHISRDDGATWQNVTPRMLGKFTRVSIIEPSHFDAGAAYVAANRYQQDDFRPYLYKTSDYGRSWTAITTGIPTGAYTRAIREDPLRRGLLFAGTETGVYYSTDDGGRWQSLQINLPRASVRDLHVHDADLIAATHGRSFWVLDDITALRQLSDSVRRQSAHLFAPQQAVRFSGGSRVEGEAGANPPNGAIVDYYLAEKPAGEVTLAFLDSTGREIRRFSSRTSSDADSARTAQPGAEKTRRDSVATGKGAQRARDTTATTGKKASIEAGDDSVSYAPSDSLVPARAGINRFVWDLGYPDPQTLKEIVVDDGTTDGPTAVPGRYAARLTVGGRVLTEPFIVVKDPRLSTTPEEFARQFALASQVRDKLDETARTVLRIEEMQRQLDARITQTKAQPYAARVADAVRALRPKLETIRQELAEVHSHADQSTLHYPLKLYNKLISLNAMVQSADAAPTHQQGEIYRDLAAQVDAQVARLKDLEASDVAAFNRLMRELEVPAVMADKK